MKPVETAAFASPLEAISHAVATFSPSVSAARVTRRSIARKAASPAGDGMSGAIDPKSLGARIEKFLREKHSSKIAANVAADTNGRCSAYQVGKWLEGASVPNGSAMAALIAAYGPEFLIAVMPSSPAWLDAALRAERASRIEAEIDRRQRELEELRSAAL